ncbi:FMN reductase [Secundilactobacillus oryzae JCM 18671]|uniref:FMN reductase n=1 Tax=Secundilactobacillus oryzae JCM 18671 TaxID=1291743 RepID=A0A081BG62_9LACO|nr:NAD(P)H-binding protein [Secundilactobacillus oryzae]GAK47030.1 FMN reductase [Secundilactobacillus oryzae JCM 18671]
MEIGIIGATGNAGKAIFEEAVRRGHDVTAIVRDREKAVEVLGHEAKILEKDAFSLSQADLAGFDYVIDAFRSPKAYEHLDLAAKLIRLFRGNKHTTLFFILGAASLKDPSGNRLLKAILANNANAPWIETPLQQVHEYDFLTWIDNVNWTAISPQGNFKVGPATEYVMGTDQLMQNTEGESVVTTGNVAVAIVDEIEHPKHLRQRFTVVDK